MKFILLCAFFSLAVASSNHQIIVLKSETPTTEYRDEDSKGFYSYGYSSDDSAKAEYKTRDGSSKGFYSYIDSNGKLQTVKYEAGRSQGFTASATNLPTPPMDNSRAPEQVQDTPEVEMAKEAHFEAYREAAIKAAMQPDTGDDGNENDDEDNEISNVGNIPNDSTGSSENSISDEQANQLEAELQQNSHEMLLNRQNSREQLLQLLRQQQQLASQESHSSELTAKQQQQQQQQQAQQQQITQHPQLMTTYVLNAEAHLQPSTLSELKTIYRLDSSDSKVELKLGGLELEKDQQKSLDLLQQPAPIPQLSAEDALTSFESIRVPSNSYYTVNNPDTHYTVETPTVLTTLPRLVSINLNNHHLPISLSTAFSSQRLSTKSSSH